MIRSFTRAGYSYGGGGGDGTEITSSGVIVALTKDTTNSPESAAIPNFANLRTLEVQIVDIASSAATLTVYLARDAAGDIPITPGATSGASQTIEVGQTTSDSGGVVFSLDTDYHYDSNAGGTVGTLYAVLTTNTGTLDAKDRLTWRS